ncbi:ATP-dependent Clp protease proteolytic subunit 5 like [Actinidia chinensis var. chinensis]|uniref:ATP-dependent Clp protease proteolytic subunit n=1 Tax=Actinidia chinensis var. chinensis TaxID=1590841 RepID=A0A2R6QD42_ACTCC|nr:ATP-dependent Clp protease proteolytic subunit 5 like [Actinidia chinensis var. chinensis]
MAQVSSSAASLRLHSLVFSFAYPSVFPDSKTLALPFQPLRSRKLRKLASKQHKVRSSSLKATCSGESWESARGLRRGIWSIRDDLQIPSSPYIPNSSQGQGPPPMVQERFMSVLSQLFHHRIIRCGGPVDDEMANMIVAQLLYLDAVDPTKDIVMYVNSPGGSVTSGMAIFDTMKHIRPDVSTVCVGIAASMSAFLLSSGTKGKRFSLPNARIMVHQPIGGLQGSTTEVDIQFAELTHHKVNLSGYLAYQTGQTIEKIEEDSSCDFFMSATEAVEYGIIDGVITNPLKGLLQSVAANADQ